MWWTVILGCDPSGDRPAVPPNEVPEASLPPTCVPDPEADVAGDEVDGDCDGSDGPSIPLGDVPSAGSTAPEFNLQFGFALAAGDVDGDGDVEVLVGSQEYDWRTAHRAAGPRDNGQVSLSDGGDLAEVGLWHGREAGRFFGRAIGMGDVTGDGRDDAVAGGGGEIAIVAGGAPPSDAPLFVGWPQQVGDWLWVGDVTGDPTADLLLQAGDDTDGANLPQLWIHAGPISGSTDLADPGVVVTGAASSAVIADFDGDGIPDLAAGDEGEAERLYLGPVVGPEVLPGDADAVWTGDSAQDWFAGFASSGDLDGDGLPELFVAATAWPDNERHGRVYVFDPDAVAPVAVIDGEPPRQFFGRSVVSADLDRDGNDDLVVGAPAIDSPGPGRVAVFFGPVAGSWSGADADLAFAGEHPGDHAGAALAVGDVNGDGAPDLIVGAPTAESGGLEDAGRVYLLEGPF